MDIFNAICLNDKALQTLQNKYIAALQEDYDAKAAACIINYNEDSSVIKSKIVVLTLQHNVLVEEINAERKGYSKLCKIEFN